LNLRELEENVVVGVMRVGDSQRTMDAVFGLASVEGGIRFPRRISNAYVELATTVELGVQGGDFVIGPEVVIDSALLRVNSENVRVLIGPSDEDGVYLRADTYVGPDAGLSLTPYPVGGVAPAEFIGVSWPDVAYPWVQFKTSWPEFDDSTADLSEAAR